MPTLSHPPVLDTSGAGIAACAGLPQRYRIHAGDAFDAAFLVGSDRSRGLQQWRRLRYFQAWLIYPRRPHRRQHSLRLPLQGAVRVVASQVGLLRAQHELVAELGAGALKEALTWACAAGDGILVRGVVHM